MKKILMPDEVEKRNVITEREIKVMVFSLTHLLECTGYSRSQYSAIKSVLPKLNKTLAAMK